MNRHRRLGSGARIVVLQPPLRDFYMTGHRMNGLGTGLVFRILEKAGFTVECLNFPLRGGGKKLMLPEALAHLSPYMVPGERGPGSGFRYFQRFGPDFPDAAREVHETRPDLVLIGLFAWAYGEDAFDMAKALKELDPGVPVGIGGAGVTVGPDRFERSGLFDLLFLGEAEAILGRWIDSGAPVQGRFQAEGVGQKELRRDFEPAVAFRPDRGELSLSVSRGCPMRCSFCANRLVHGRSFRTVPVEKVMGGIEEELSRFEQGFSRELEKERDRSRGEGRQGQSLGRRQDRVKKIFFEDDNLSADAGWFRELLTGLSESFPGVEMSAENGIDYRFLDSEKLELMHRAGFRRLNLSIASADEVQLKRQHRTGGLEAYRGLLEEAAKLGMEGVTYFITGLPGERPETAVKNLLFLLPLPTQVGISMFYPVPGIGGFEDPSILEDVPFQRALGSAAWPWGGGYSTAQLLTAFRLARITNMLKDESLREEDGRVLERIRRTGRLHTRVGKNGEVREIPWADRGMTELFLEGL